MPVLRVSKSNDRPALVSGLLIDCSAFGPAWAEAMEQETKSSTSYHRFASLLTLLSLGHLLAFVDRAKLAGAMPAIRRQIVMSDTEAGWIIGAAFAVGYGVTIFTMIALRGHEQSRWSWRLPVGLALWAVASLSTGLASSASALIGARFLVGVGQALFIPAALSWVVAAGDRAHARTTGLATFTAAASLGRSIGLLMIGLALAVFGWLGMAGAMSWRWSFVLTALPNLALLIFLLRSRLRDPTATAEAGERQRIGWARPIYLALGIMPIILTQAVAGWAPTLFVLDRGVTPQAAATWLGTMTFAGSTGGVLLAGRLMQRVRRWQRCVPLVIVGSMTAALPGLVLAGWGPGWPSATVGMLLVNVTLGLAAFATLLGWQQLTPDSGRVASNGVFLAVITIVGVGLGPLATGFLADHGPALRTALMTTAVLCVIAAAALALAAQPLYRKHCVR